jgi:hypothetical protein
MVPDKKNEIIAQNAFRLVQAAAEDRQSFLAALSPMRRTECAIFMLKVIREDCRVLAEGVIKTIKFRLREKILIMDQDETMLKLDVYSAILEDKDGALELADYVLRWYDKHFQPSFDIFFDED